MSLNLEQTIRDISSYNKPKTKIGSIYGIFGFSFLNESLFQMLEYLENIILNLGSIQRMHLFSQEYRINAMKSIKS